MKKKFLLACAVIGIAVFVAVGLANNLKDVQQTIERLSLVRQPGGVSGLSLGPFIGRGVKYVTFYIVGGAVTGALLGILAWLLAAPGGKPEGTSADLPAAAGPAPPLSAPPGRRRHHVTFGVLLAAFVAYAHVRMMTVHPGMFDNTYRWAWFVGDPLWVMVVQLVGLLVPLLILLFLLRKYATPIGAFLRRRKAPVAIVALVVAAGAGGWWGLQTYRRSRPGTNEGPNVIIISLDSVRPDHISWKRLAKPYWRETTPNIDRFLDDCVWFDQAYVPLCRTHPSWISTLTGCWPPTHGVRLDLPPKGSVLPEVPTLAQALQKAGYRTAYFLDNTNFMWMDPEVGFDTIVQPRHNVIDFYISSISPRSVLYNYFLNNRAGYLYDRGLYINAAYRNIYRPEFMNREIDRHLQRMKHENKTFTAIHLCTIHVPFCVSYPYSTMYRPSFGPVINRFGYRALVDEIMERKKARQVWTREEQAWVHTQEVNLYDALVRSADDCFGAILQSIKDAGLYDNSYIVLMSDHGENLPEKGLRYRYGSSTHGFFLWGDGDTHILLAVKFPGRRHAGRQVKRLVRSIDIAPTLLDALGMPALETAEGVSRMPDLDGEEDDRERWLYAETGLSAPRMMGIVDNHLTYEFAQFQEAHTVDPETLKIYKKDEYEPNLIAAKDRMIRTEKWKVIAYPVVVADPKTSEPQLSHRVELFDVTVDPNCVNDVSTTNPAVREELFGKLLPFIQKDLKRFGTGKVRAVARRENTAP